MVRLLSLCLAPLALVPACKGDHGLTFAPGASSAPSTSTNARQAQVADAPIADAQLASAITEAIARDPVLRSLPLHPSAADGAVTLTGTVRTLAAKWRATRLVASFKGVVAVTDAVLVKTSARTDAEITKDARDALASDPATRNASVQIGASLGTVTLKGTVDSYAQRDLLAEAAARVRGVQAVNLSVAVTRVSSRSDAEIATDVTDEMRDDARLDGTSVAVGVRARKAVLAGVVGSLAQREAAVEDAWNAGVAGVDAEAVRIDWLDRARGRRILPLPVPSDADIGNAVGRVLSGDARVGTQLPSVKVEHGVVTLSGSVVDFRAQRAAYRDARRIGGIRQVENDTTILPEERESDATIQRQVLQGIYDDVAASGARDVQVTALHARVTLSGAVASPEDKRVIEDDVEEVPGVVAVENDLRVPGYVPQTEVIAPETIRHRVIEAIFWDPRVPTGEVTVEVDSRGSVTLNGQVDSWEDAQSAGEDAVRAGAAHVIDQLRVAGAR
jgi:osmotically-inducible protein OsmY